MQSTSAAVRRARAGSLAVKGAQLFNLLPDQLRNSDLANIPDEPTVSGLVRRADTNSLLNQIPIYESSFSY